MKFGLLTIGYRTGVTRNLVGVGETNKVLSSLSMRLLPGSGENQPHILLGYRNLRSAGNQAAKLSNW